MEIYLERIRDLLARELFFWFLVNRFIYQDSIAQNDNLQVHEEKNKGVYVKGLSDYYVSDTKEVYEIMRQGGASRVVTATSTWFFIYHSKMLNFHIRHERRELAITLHFLDQY